MEAITGNHEKDECKVALGGAGLLGTEAGILGGYNFQGMVLGGDGAHEQGKMGAWFCCLQKGNVKGCIRVGREQEGTRSSRPELAALEIALRQATDKDEDVV